MLSQLGVEVTRAQNSNLVKAATVVKSQPNPSKTKAVLALAQAKCLGNFQLQVML